MLLNTQLSINGSFVVAIRDNTFVVLQYFLLEEISDPVL